MSDFEQALAELSGRVGGTRAAVILERSGIEVATCGEADFEDLAVELAELWNGLGSLPRLSAGSAVRALALTADAGTWVATPLGDEYLLALWIAPETPPGRALFYAREWAAARRGEFS